MGTERPESGGWGEKERETGYKGAEIESETETKGDRGTVERDTHIEKQREQGASRHRNRKRQGKRVQAAGEVWFPVGRPGSGTGRQGPCSAQLPPQGCCLKFLGLR